MAAPQSVLVANAQHASALVRVGLVGNTGPAGIIAARFLVALQDALAEIVVIGLRVHDLF